MGMNELHWKTGITRVAPNEIQVRGYRVEELMGRLSFPQVIYLIFKGELPSQNVGKMIDAILVSSIDHGATPPSTLAARTVASTGSTLNAALASGILAINKYHGGAIEGCMKFLLEIRSKYRNSSISKEEAVQEVLEEYREKKIRVPGFGHRLHTRDPRSKKLFALAARYQLAGDFVSIAHLVERALQQISGKSLPINVDGAIAAILCELEFSPALANAFFIIARTPGLIAHIIEEQTREKPMRKIHPVDHEYDGFPSRNLSES